MLLGAPLSEGYEGVDIQGVYLQSFGQVQMGRAPPLASCRPIWRAKVRGRGERKRVRERRAPAGLQAVQPVSALGFLCSL